MENLSVSTGMSSHQYTKMLNDEWLTPPHIMESLCVFDLDPCSPVHRPWPTAKTHYSKIDDGLNKDWFGRVWLNPPYGTEAAKWLAKMVEHNNGIALIFARTETKAFFKYIWGNASAILFIKGRLFFHYVDGSVAKNNSGAPSALVAYGAENAEILKSSQIEGRFVYLNGNKSVANR